MSHEIIDNRKTLLVDKINTILDSTESARFAVGYFFLSGFTSITKNMDCLKELKLLIGNTTTQETIEQIAEGYRRLDLVKDRIEEEAYPQHVALKQMASTTADNIRTSVEVMDQTDDHENVVRSLVKMIENKRLKVKVYVKGRLHAKAYIFDYGQVYDDRGNPVERQEKGIAIVGSSNLTLAGVAHNTELNVMVPGNDNHAELARWFDELWDEAQYFDEALMTELKQSWALMPATPYDIYMKTLYALVKARLVGSNENPLLFDDEITNELADFQAVAVKHAIQIIRDHGGVFISDVVGLGKSYIGAAIVKHFRRIEHSRPLIICPASLLEMWDGDSARGTNGYNQTFELGAEVISMGLLDEARDILGKDRYKDCDFVLIDESHNLRYTDIQRYKIVEAFLSTGKKCCLLTATPRNKTAWDIYNQLRLFQPDKTDLPISPPDLKQYFKMIENGERELRALLPHVLIRRTRKHILRWYGYDADTNLKVDPAMFQDYVSGRKRAYIIVKGKHQFFPKRELETVDYSIEEAYQGLYNQLRAYLGKRRNLLDGKPVSGELSYARYALWHFVAKEKQTKSPYNNLQHAGMNLRGLMRILMFKRFESSVYAFRETIQRQINVHKLFIKALDAGIVPAGDKAENIMYDPNAMETQDILDSLARESNKYNISDFNIVRLKEYINHDLALFQQMLNMVAPITPNKDAKLQKLIDILSKKPLNEGKRLIFTQYADTADYLYNNLNPDGKRTDIDVIYSGDKSKARIVGRFAPKANPQYQRAPGESELMTVIATDVLAEGLNLQDCDKIVNYDLHWNPVRLIQRLGRIDRIGSEHDTIMAYNFLPEIGLEQQLGLRDKLHNRIQEIHDTIGEDAQIMDKTEQLNEEAMYAIYEKNSAQLSLLEEDTESIDINEAEEMMRQLQKEDPSEFERIANLRDGIRSAKSGDSSGWYIMCQADNYQKLYLLNQTEAIVNNELGKILGSIRADRELKPGTIPPGYNKVINSIRSNFAAEVRQLRAEKEFSLSLSQGQKYALRELRSLFALNDDKDYKNRITLLENAFKGRMTVAVGKELNKARRNGIAGESLIKYLSDLYIQHNMKDWSTNTALVSHIDVPRVICSERIY